VQIGLFTDASNSSIGACLQQYVQDNWQPLAFFSKKMTQNQCHWPAYYRELLAVYESVHFRHILEVQPCTIFTDHKPLVYAFQQKRDKLPPVQLNQLTFIAQFTTDIRHISGSKNVVADAMSRVESMTNVFDYKELSESQNVDDELQDLLKGQTSLIFQKLKISGSSVLLYCDISTGKPRPFLTTPFRRQAFDQLHNLSHPGVKAYLRLIADRFVWPSMRKDCRLWAKSCVQCQRSKITRHVKTPLGSFQSPTERFSHIHVDLIGPLPSCRSYKYCMTIIDRFTRWSEVYPLECITAESVTLGFLSCWLSRFGRPSMLTTDRGTQFTSSIFKTIAKQYGIELHFTNSRHPQANGMIERLHRQLKAAIMAHSTRDWVEALPLVMLGIRATFKEDIGATAAELVYGEPLRLPGQFFNTSDNYYTEDPNTLLHRLRQHIYNLRPVPASKHAKPGTFVFQDLKSCSHAFLRDDSVRKSLQPPYLGPYEVVERDSKSIILKKSDKPTKVSIDRVKPAYILVDGDPPGPSKSDLPETRKSSENADRITRSGRRVRFPDFFVP